MRPHIQPGESREQVSSEGVWSEIEGMCGVTLWRKTEEMWRESLQIQKILRECGARE